MTATLKNMVIDTIGVPASGVPAPGITKAQVDRVAKHADPVGQVFYTKLFEATPEFARIFTQPSNKATIKGHPKQFVKAVIEYAYQVAVGTWDEDEDDELIEALVQKHRALMTESSYYPRIGASFIGALEEVLSLDSKEVTDWSTLYSSFANYLVKQAQVIDTMNAQADGGWSGYRKMRISERYMETPEVVTLTLKPVLQDKNQDILMPEPGQYLGLRLDMDCGVEYRKQYSIANVFNRDTDDFYQISVQKQPGGVVSKHIHDKLRLGDTVEITPPGGNFNLRDVDNQLKPCVMIAAGIGAIPMKSLAYKAAVEHKLKTRFIQCDRSTKVQLYGDFFKKLQGNENFRYKLFLSQQTTGIPSSGVQGRLTQDQLEELLPGTSMVPNIYVCGPLYFMLDVRRWLDNLGYTKNISYEYFGPQVI